MGNAATGGSTQPIPKSQLVRILKRARKLAIRQFLNVKKQNIEERYQYFKQDAVKYRDCVFAAMQNQQKLVQDIVLEICNEQNVSVASLTGALQSHMMDPEVHELVVGFQTLSGDLCENYPIPENLTIEHLKEGLQLQIRELAGYPIRDAPSSALAQIAVCDEVFRVMGIDELTFGALAIKHERSADPDLARLKEEWNKASKFDLSMAQARNH